MPKREYTPFLVESLLRLSAFLAVIFLLFFIYLKTMGASSPIVIMAAYQLGFSAGAYMAMMPTVRCFLSNTRIEAYHYGLWAVGCVLVWHTYGKLNDARVFITSWTLLAMMVPPGSMLLHLFWRKLRGATIGVVPANR